MCKQQYFLVVKFGNKIFRSPCFKEKLLRLGCFQNDKNRAHFVTSVTSWWQGCSVLFCLYCLSQKNEIDYTSYKRLCLLKSFIISWKVCSIFLSFLSYHFCQTFCSFLWLLETIFGVQICCMVCYKLALIGKLLTPERLLHCIVWLPFVKII